MTAWVPHRVNGITVSDIDAGRAVRGVTWIDTANLMNYVLGRGAQLIPCNFGTDATLTATRAYVYKYRCKPRFQAYERIWVVHMRSVGNDPSDVAVKVPASGSAVTVRALVTRNATAPHVFREVLASQSAAETELSIEIDPTDADIVVDSISCWEAPRPSLATNNADEGTDPVLLNPGQPVLASSLENLVDAAADDDTGRRVSLGQWAVPSTDNGATTTAFAYTTTSATYVDMFPLPIPILTRKLGRTATTGTITAKFLAWVSSNDGDIRLDFNGASSATSSAVNITATSPTWSSAVTLSVDADDLGEADGLPSSTWGMLDVEARQNTAGNLFIASVSCWED